MNKKIRFGLIGCSKRGTGLLTGVLIPMLEENILLCATCDKYIDRAENAAEAVEKAGYPKPFVTADYKELIAKGNLDAVIISSSWETHVEIATAFMRAGIPVGLEVGGAYSLNDCWKLVNTYEETGTHCMLLENCCYGKRELMLLNMVRSGILGEIVHCAGGYRGRALRHAGAGLHPVYQHVCRRTGPASGRRRGHRCRCRIVPLH